MVEDYFGNALPHILDGGNCEKGIESTIVGFDGDTPIIYRQGAISVDAIEFVAGKTKVLATVKEKVTTPGMAPMHYAPRTRFLIVEDIKNYILENPHLSIGVLSMCNTFKTGANVFVVLLTSRLDLEEASKNLYQSMHYLDGLNLDCIIIERFPEIGIGKSLNDRITRASLVLDC
jgi:L-threonylcarbamoyladenylate synthase